VALIILIALATAAWGQSDPLCPWLAGCEYEAPGFSIRVVDKRTGEPLPDVHALAMWNQFGGPGREGPVMALEAISDANGFVSFAAWGPVRGGGTGLVPGRDPAISLFRPGYATLLIENHSPVGRPFNTRVHAFQQTGQTFGMTTFQGMPAETVVELTKAADPLTGSGLSQHDLSAIRRAFVNRWMRVRAEAQRLPRHLPQVEQLLRFLEDDIRLFTSGGG
jgi:hypothetical protein